MRLFEEYDGEKWMDNPRKRRRGKKRKARRATRRHHAVASNPPRRRRRRGGAHKRRRGGRRFGHNPPSFGGLTRGIGARAMTGLKDGAIGVLGKAAARQIPAIIKLPRTGFLSYLVQAGVGIFGAPLVDKVVRGGGRAFLQGAFMAPIESLAIGANVPLLSAGLSSYGDDLRALPTPGADIKRIAAYEGYSNEGMDEDNYAVIQ